MSNVRRFPSLGQIATISPERAYFDGGAALRYNRVLERVEGITSIRHLCIPYAATQTLSGASVAYTNLIPAGVVLLGGVTARNLTAVTGATAYRVGTADDLDLFAAAAAITALAETGFADQQWVNVIRYTIATTVLLTAVGSNFTGGLVEVTAWGLPY